MSGRITVAVHVDDPISAAGITSELRSNAEILVVTDEEADHALVTVVVADELDERTSHLVRGLQHRSASRVVMIVTRLDDAGLLAAVEAGACGILRRSEATSARLAQAVRAAAEGDGSVPPDLLGRLLNQVSRLQRNVLAPRGLSLSGFSDREVDVLRLLADGWDTGEIAGKLAYSERTVKNVIHDITSRLHLRNRSHAVAYALRQGLI